LCQSSDYSCKHQSLSLSLSLARTRTTHCHTDREDSSNFVSILSTVDEIEDILSDAIGKLAQVISIQLALLLCNKRAKLLDCFASIIGTVCV
jgi:hypothetical protein